MRRFAATYRWELYLLFGIPTVVGVIGMVGFRFPPWGDAECPGTECLWWFTHALLTLQLVLLGAVYPFVRRQGRELLTLLWEVEVALKAVSLAFFAATLVSGHSGPPWSFPLFEWTVEVREGTGGTTATPYSLSMYYLVKLPVYLWFVRRAARASMGHAFLLYALTLADSAFALDPHSIATLEHQPSLVYGSLAAISMGAQVGLNAFMLWALVRRDVFSPLLRCRTSAALVTASVLVGLLQWYTWWSVTLGPILLGGRIYQDIGFSWEATAWRTVALVSTKVPMLAFIFLVSVRRDSERPPVHPCVSQ